MRERSCQAAALLHERAERRRRAAGTRDFSSKLSGTTTGATPNEAARKSWGRRAAAAPHVQKRPGRGAGPLLPRRSWVILLQHHEVLALRSLLACLHCRGP